MLPQGTHSAAEEVLHAVEVHGVEHISPVLGGAGGARAHRAAVLANQDAVAEAVHVAAHQLEVQHILVDHRGGKVAAPRTDVPVVQAVLGPTVDPPLVLVVLEGAGGCHLIWVLTALVGIELHLVPGLIGDI
eukprot:CAMPEP_0181495168 /NCGR_PEP_ID=MMETSP1110-20121109/52222_1 /TAXON_ID=174948 /ORGANISM="Symbiodinium sp., Strain CCMP421" /LENGTH=131 /DNA_ID=CAMNT_0023622751 /DNA_START=140 /DNA_END=534 /DNA_ORIENTATION=-